MSWNFFKYAPPQKTGSLNRLFFYFIDFWENKMEHLFCYALLNAFFDASDANFSLTRERSRPVYFPALQQKFQSRDKINFTPRRFLLEEPRAKSRLSPTRRQNSCRKQSQNLLALSGVKIAFPSQKATSADLGVEKQPILPLEKCPKMGNWV